MAIVRPTRGVKPEEALRHWSDPEAYAAMEGFQDAAENKSGIKEYEARHKEYVSRRQPLERAFQDRLESREILGSGIIPGDDGRSIIRPSLWRVLEIRYDFEDASGGLREYEELEFFDSSAIPLNVEEVPSWLQSASPKEFRHDASYKEVEVRGLKFKLSPLKAKVVKLLHLSALHGSPWRSGKQILNEAETIQTKMHDVFKPWSEWEELIESDGTGLYRLRLE